jgi:hypothetical protein
MPERVTAECRRGPDGEVRTVYRVDGRSVTNTDRVEDVVDAVDA